MSLNARKIAQAFAAAAVLAIAGSAWAQEPAAPDAAQATPPTEMAAPAAAPDAAPAAPAPSGPIGAPPEGKAQIVFFRPSRFAGGALTFTVRENDADLGRLASGRYFVQVADPGVHEYQIGRNDTMRIEVEAGQTYYVQNNIAMGIMAGRAVLAPTDQAAFEQALPHMHLYEPDQH